MRILIYASLLNNRNFQLIECMCASLTESKHIFHLITKEQTRVLHNNKHVLSRNYNNIVSLKNKFGIQNTSLLLSDLSIKPLISDSIFEEHNTLVIEAI